MCKYAMHIFVYFNIKLKSIITSEKLETTYVLKRIK